VFAARNHDGVKCAAENGNKVIFAPSLPKYYVVVYFFFKMADNPGKNAARSKPV
jgi:hypothetical protein